MTSTKPTVPTPKPPRVVLVHRKLDATSAQRVAELRSQVADLGLTLNVRVAGDARPSESSRPSLAVLSPADAFEIYRFAHQGPVMVCAIEKVWVRRNPANRSDAETELRPLAEFVCHKACHLLVSDRSAIAALEATFAEWRASSSCAGIGDPRALPLQVFDAERPWPELAEAGGRKKFNLLYGTAIARIDAGRRQWNKAVPHGRATDFIAGTELTAGAHWDVGARRGAELISTAQVWQIPARSYVNVYPDGGVRGGSSDVPPARRTWPPADERKRTKGR